MENRIRAMYFSGTGTTEKVATAIADRMCRTIGGIKAPDINFSPKKAREQHYVFDERDLIVFGVPVIAGRVPNVLLKFLDTLQGGGAMVVPVVLYGNRNFDDALIELRNILEDKGFHPIAAAAFIGEHSFSEILAAGRPDAEDMELAKTFADRVAGKVRTLIEQAEGNPAQIAETLEKIGPVSVEGQVPIRDYYKPRDRKGNHINILKVKPKLYEERCNHCGICVAACPMDSIKENAPGVVDGICIKCCGCVKKCPQQALYFDDAGYLYHKEELELEYGDVRKEPSLFV